MNCKQCGAELNDDAKFCTSCGSVQEEVVQAEPVVEEATQETPVAQTVETNSTNSDTNLDDLSGEILKWGIMALAFAVAGVCVSFLGIIFGAKTSKLVKQYEAIAPLEGRAKVGQSLGKAGFIAGIALTAFWVFYIMIIGCVACLGVASSGYYY